MRTRTTPFLPPGTAPLSMMRVRLFVNADYFKVLGRNGIATHVTRKANALEHTGRICALANGTGSTMEVCTVSARAACEVVTTHNTCEALTLRSTGYVYLLHLSECGNGNFFANSMLGSILYANLAEMAEPGSTPCLAKWPAMGLLTFFSLMVPKPS